ncbi:sirohydrochlorin chelatase [Paenarthrobacter sp. DKR-5]|uniref:sirohydrochlorin chelatase n=1 Tax=Paenarthrobacter sp. DKR-5 TaxID=2835535 RepID=UPI001BDCAF08|nr:sirohydrochlorin chelatase [Paenarthrobacter sp. DKR-5]MBT1001229.1 sirohydrochlorin chelatase [Paenarthrobacter sp. DKR-5]
MATSDSPVLIACSHGTADRAGQAAVSALAEQIRQLRPGLDVRETFVDVQHPQVPEVVAGVEQGRHAVVVPLLLSVGYHVRVDIARAVRSREGITAAAPLGPDRRLAALLDRRLAEAGAAPEDAVVLAAAGSSDPHAARDVQQLAGMLAELRANRILAAYGASAEPDVPSAVAVLRKEGAPRVVIASYLLAPGYFHSQLLKAGADLVTQPLLPDESLARIALDRFDEALAKAAG